MKLYLHPLSPPALGVELVASAIGLKFEKIIVDLAGGQQREPSYQSINPVGKVPAMDDDGFLLSESLAIMRYIAKRELSPLYPMDIKAQAKTEQWMDFIAHHVRVPMGRVQFNRLVAPMLDQQPDEAAIQVALHLLNESLPVIEAHLSAYDFLSGPFSLADISLVAALDSAELLKVSLSDYPKLSAWRAHQRRQDYYQNVHTHFGAEVGL